MLAAVLVHEADWKCVVVADLSSKQKGSSVRCTDKWQLLSPSCPLPPIRQTSAGAHVCADAALGATCAATRRKSLVRESC